MQVPEEESRKYHADFADAGDEQQVGGVDMDAGTIQTDDHEAAIAGTDETMENAVTDIQNANKVCTLLGMPCISDSRRHRPSMHLIHGMQEQNVPDDKSAEGQQITHHAFMHQAGLSAAQSMCWLQDPSQTASAAEPAQAAAAQAAADAGAASAEAAAAAVTAAEASAAALAATPSAIAGSNDSSMHDERPQPPALLDDPAPPQLSDVVLPDVQPGNGAQTPAVCPALASIGSDHIMKLIR